MDIINKNPPSFVPLIVPFTDWRTGHAWAPRAGTASAGCNVVDIYKILADMTHWSISVLKMGTESQVSSCAGPSSKDLS